MTEPRRCLCGFIPASGNLKWHRSKCQIWRTRPNRRRPRVIVPPKTPRHALLLGGPNVLEAVLKATSNRRPPSLHQGNHAAQDAATQPVLYVERIKLPPHPASTRDRCRTAYVQHLACGHVKCCIIPKAKTSLCPECLKAAPV